MLVVGVGNTLAGADGFGPAVVRALQADASMPEGVCLIDAHTDLLAHLHRFHEADHVVLVDAVLDENRRGVAAIPEERFTAWSEVEAVSAHHLSPVAAVQLFRTLDPHAPARFTLVAWFVRSDDFARAPEPPVIAGGVRAVRELLGLTDDPG